MILAGNNQIAVTVERRGHISVARDVGVDGTDQIGDRIGPGRGVFRGIGAVTDGDRPIRGNPEG